MPAKIFSLEEEYSFLNSSSSDAKFRMLDFYLSGFYKKSVFPTVFLSLRQRSFVENGNRCCKYPRELL